MHSETCIHQKHRERSIDVISDSVVQMTTKMHEKLQLQATENKMLIN